MKTGTFACVLFGHKFVRKQTEYTSEGWDTPGCYTTKWYLSKWCVRCGIPNPFFSQEKSTSATSL